MTDAPAGVVTGTSSEGPVIQRISKLAREASVELNVQDEKYLDEARGLVPPGTRLYVSHLPGQDWAATIQASAAVRRAGFDPVPHVPVRLLTSANAFERLLTQFRKVADAREILLISGDYSQAAGPYHAVSQVMATAVLRELGFTRVSFAGHPEGHPQVGLGDIRFAEWEKVQLANRQALETTLVTQFLFEPEPFFKWVDEHQAQGLLTRFVCGLAGPAKVSTLVRYAMRCGVGPSVRALGAHRASLKNLPGDHGPDRMLRPLAQRQVAKSGVVSGVHLFCFGGFIRTARWLSRVAAGEFQLRPNGGFDV